MADARLGIIGTDNTHAHVYAAFLNGWAFDRPIPTYIEGNSNAGSGMYLWAKTLRDLATGEGARLPVSGGRVTRIWSADPSDARQIAQACEIETVCDEPAEVCEEVDAVMVLSEDPSTHLEYAGLALTKGVPVYVDKPLAEGLEDGQRLADLAESTGTPWFTCSALRYSPELIGARARAAAEIGDLHAVYASCPNEFRLYGIHVVEMVNALMGAEVDTVWASFGKSRDVAFLEIGSGVSAVIETIRASNEPIYYAILYGEYGAFAVAVRDFGRLFIPLVEAVVEMAQTKEAPIPASEGLWLNSIVWATRLSADLGKRVVIERQAGRWTFVPDP
jgi:predicted dehydrogenase